MCVTQTPKRSRVEIRADYRAHTAAIPLHYEFGRGGACSPGSDDVADRLSNCRSVCLT